MTYGDAPKMLWPVVGWAVAVAAATCLGPITPAAAAPSSLATLVAAERNFARDAGRIGIDAAFRAHAAADAILIQPDPAPAAPQLAGSGGSPDTVLQWQPELAGVARSDDLGFTTGPYRLVSRGKAQHGQYLTVWQRDDDGHWKWYLDHGSSPVPGDLKAPLPVNFAPLRYGAAARVGDPADTAARADVMLNAALVQKGGSALVDALAGDAVLLRPGREPVKHAYADAVVRDYPVVAAADLLATRQSKAGDLAVSYGRITAGAASRIGYYVRIWRRGSAGWRVVVDELVWRQS